MSLIEIKSRIEKSKNAKSRILDDYSLIEFDDNWDYADKIANTAPTD